MIYVKINDVLYPATISGKMSDKDWDGRATKTIRLTMDHETALNLWVDGIFWSIVQQDITHDYQYNDEGIVVFNQETGEPVMKEYVNSEEFDNSEYNVAGPITDYRDGTIAVTMGKLTELEEAYEILLGGME